jgi:hypothetical protein
LKCSCEVDASSALCNIPSGVVSQEKDSSRHQEGKEFSSIENSTHEEDSSSHQEEKELSSIERSTHEDDSNEEGVKIVKEFFAVVEEDVPVVTPDGHQNAAITEQPVLTPLSVEPPFMNAYDLGVQLAKIQLFFYPKRTASMMSILQLRSNTTAVGLLVGESKGIELYGSTRAGSNTSRVSDDDNDNDTSATSRIVEYSQGRKVVFENYGELVEGQQLTFHPQDLTLQFIGSSFIVVIVLICKQIILFV